MIILTDQQKSGIEMVFNNRFSILTGKPGTGKSTVIKHILDRADKEKIKTVMAAPTGKAAKRIIETTGRFASTIHQLLMPIFNGESFSFGHNKDNYINAGLIIIDEVSMLDNQLAADFFEAVNPQLTRVLFVGDDNQLPSVGAGNILYDLISSKKFARTDLDKIHRNSGLIVEACSKIYRGRYFEKNSMTVNLSAENPINLLHIDMDSPEGIRDRIVKAVSNIVDNGLHSIEEDFNPFFDIQVLSPVNEKGEMSCRAINEKLRKVFNHGFDESKKISFGDKVINTKNVRLTGIEDKKEHLVVNGDIGVVTDDKRDFYGVCFSDPDRYVKVKKSENYMRLAYCITCHRFQGSEAPIIIIPIHKSFTYFTNRNWLYTAISRGKKLVVTVGDFGAMKRIIDNTRGTERATMLKSFLNKNLIK